MAQDPKQDTATTEAEGWRPKSGDILTGKVTEVAKGWSDYTDSYYPIVTIEDNNGKRHNVHCFHEILKQRMLDVRPEIGQEIEIECLGEKETRDKKRKYVGYRVTIPGETGARVWDDLGEQDKRAASTAAPQKSLLDESPEDIPF